MKNCEIYIVAGTWEAAFVLRMSSSQRERNMRSLTERAEELLVLRVIQRVEERGQVRPLADDRQDLGGVHHLRGKASAAGRRQQRVGPKIDVSSLTALGNIHRDGQG